ncbi:TetR/AcrR family transcriptional regulator [Dermacoccaceae bacterium W4C1]
MNTSSRSRVEQRHDRTVAEVKAIAWERLNDEGAGTLSLRAIARDLGVVPSALYRYFPSHGHLLDALADDATQGVIDRLRAADAEPDRTDHEARLSAVTHSCRSWAMENREAFSLLFGCLSHDRANTAGVRATVEQIVQVYVPNLREAHEAGRIDLSNHPRCASLPTDRPPTPEELASRAALGAWATLHGNVTLEVGDQLPVSPTYADGYYETLLTCTMRIVGFGH